jgi:hypothetical protein
MDVVANKVIKSYEEQEDNLALLNVVLSPLAALQQFPGIAWELNYKDVIYKVSLKIPVLFITGDSEGQDKLVGRTLQYSNLKPTAHICRYCNVPYEQTDDPDYKPRLTKATMRIWQMIDVISYPNLGTLI